MGCGASSGGGGKRYADGRKREAPPQEPSHEPEQDPVEKKKGHGKDTLWHRKNCTDNDLSLVHTIQEAYPFDAKDTQIITKKEKVWNPTGDGVKHNWGDVAVAKMIKQIKCVGCKCQILDRYEEVPFYFCMRCRSTGEKHCDLCTECYNQGVLKTGERHPANIGGKKREDSFGGHKIQAQAKAKGSGMSEDNLYMNRQSSGPSRSSEPRRPSKNSNNSGDGGAGSRPVVRNASGGGRRHATLPCGNWKGKIFEGASGRPVAFSLFFSEGGEVTGTGSENSQVQGSLPGMGKLGHKVTWQEKLDWGTVTFTGEIDEHNAPPFKMKGTFKASDGGGGKLELSA